MNGISKQTARTSQKGNESLGLFYGLVGVLVFSLTLPASRAAVGAFGAIIVGPGRGLIAAVFATLFLWLKHERWPGRRYFSGFVVIIAGAILGFPLLSAWAAEGGRMASNLGGWQVIAWSVLLSTPIVVILLVGDVAWNGTMHIMHASWMAWVGLLYLGIGSQFFGFVAWYMGMGIGGVARVSQMQYLQPFFTLFFSWLLLGEILTLPTIAAALVVVLWVAVGKKTPIRKETFKVSDR